MKLIIKYLLLISFVFFASSCASLRHATVNVSEDISNYKYFYLISSTELTSSTGVAFGSNYGAYGVASTKSVVPGDMIAGYLLKKGYIRLTEIDPDRTDKTMIVSYGESGQRNVGLGTAIEVTIQFTSADNERIIATTTAEGQGETEADDIRRAIQTALNGLFGKD